MFFTNYPRTLYKFGTEKSDTAIQNLSAYVDIIDQIKDNINFYEFVEIQDGERADTVSQDLYGTVKFYWTLYLLNDNIREKGWPLSQKKVREKAIEAYPNTVLTTRDVDGLIEHFQVGDTVTGQSSGAVGVIIKRNLDLGQLVVDKSSTEDFSSTEVIRDNSNIGFPQNVTLAAANNEYEAVHHYLDTNNVIVDVDPSQAPSSALIPVTYLDRYIEANDELRRIKVIKRSSINQVAKAYQETLRTS